MTESLYDVLGTVDDDLGEIAYPEWRASATLSIAYDDYRFNWSTRMIGGGAADWTKEVDEDGDTDYDYGFTDTNVNCDGLYSDAAQTQPLFCRNIAETEDYFVHNASLSWTTDDFRINVGVRNVFNEEPQRTSSGSRSKNIPRGVGYDTMGRTPYINITASF